MEITENNEQIRLIDNILGNMSIESSLVVDVNRMELKAVEGDYGLPSFDYYCLQLLLAARLSEQNLKLDKTSWGFPVLKKDNKSITDFSEIFRILSNSVDPDLTPKQEQDKYLLKNLITQSIQPATLYLYWCDRQNYSELTSEWYSSSRGTLFAYLYLNSYRQKAFEILKMQYTYTDLSHLHSQILQNFASACRICATHLQIHQTPFLFGDTPTTIDIMLYGYLAPILKIPFKNNDFAHLIRRRQQNLHVLRQYINLITTVYFPEIHSGERYLHILHEQRREQSSNLKILPFVFIALTVVVTVCGLKYDIFATPSTPQQTT